MIQRLLLDGVDLQGGGGAISQAIELPALIDANEAESRLTGMDVAVAWTKVAMYSSAGLSFPPTGFVPLFGLLEDLKLFHESPSQTVLKLQAEVVAELVQCYKGNVFDVR